MDGGVPAPELEDVQELGGGAALGPCFLGWRVNRGGEDRAEENTGDKIGKREVRDERRKRPRGAGG